MQRKTTLSQDLINYSKVERLDRACCRLLANKPILASNLASNHTEYDKIEYDLETIAILGLGEPERSQRDILKLLSVLMEPQIETERKKQILETDFAIPMTVEMEREASEMCTLGESIARENLEKGIIKGRAEGWAAGRTEGESAIIKRMLKRGRSVQEIVEDTGVAEELVRKLAAEL